MNRFTQKLDQCKITNEGSEYERMEWSGGIGLIPELYPLVAAFDDDCTASGSGITETFSARSLFCAFLANMSDTDLFECFRI